MPDLLGAFGLSASAGLNAYIPLLVIALAGRIGLVKLDDPYILLQSPWTIGVLSVLLLVEVLADKVPVADHLNDIIGTIIRPTAGAIVFAASIGSIESMNQVLALILGLLTSGGVHAAKATARPMITATTAGVGNPIVSILEDVIAVVTSIVAILAPFLIGMSAIAFAFLFIWWRIKRRRKMAASGA